MKEIKIKKLVQEKYGEVAKSGSSCCAPAVSCCSDPGSSIEISTQIGYTETELQSVPEGANLGLGCGNPIALASLKMGETVLDLGAGAGLDCFLAAKQLGETGTVIGVDMTPEMVDRAKENAKQAGFRNVDFRLGELERLPVADGSVDVVISNCVINLVPNKKQVFSEIFRVLKPEGRFVVSDIVLQNDLPEPVRHSAEAYVGCVSGAVIQDKYLRLIEEAGFGEIRILGETVFPNSLTPKTDDFPSQNSSDWTQSAISLKVSGVKS